MNKMIKILLSVLMVSLSVLIVPLEEQGDDVEMEFVTVQTLTIETI